ncbi:hypothetical protein [Streptomyces celluloflavus]|uniref:hypothetical protein n=1 Tax=Streptomyces celluloflavus TaxID=58344 RepID=UPI0036CA7011
MDEKTETDTEKKEKRIDLSVAQVAGSALAAAVAAYLAGQLGVYGTIIGAGVVSVVATTGGSVFQHLFRRTGEQLKEATVTTRPKPRRSSVIRNRSAAAPAPHTDPTGVQPVVGTPHATDGSTARTTGPDTDRTQLMPQAGHAHPRDPAGAHPGPAADDATRLLRPADPDATRALPVDAAGQGRPTDKTQLVPRLDDRTMALGQPAARPAAATAPHGMEEVSTATYGTRMRGWKRPALGALAVFVLAMGVVTGIEMISGETPSGAPGTTLSNITNTGGNGRHQPSAPRSPDPGHSTDPGTGGHGTGGASSDPGTTGSTGTGKDSGKQSPAPTPSDGGKTSPGPDTSPSPAPSPSHSSGTGGESGTGGGNGGGTGSTGGQGQDEQKNTGGQQQAPDPNAP